MKKINCCEGCGVQLQNENVLNIGYTANLDNKLCMRCFRLKNYGEYESVSSTLVEYEKILSGVNRTRDLVIYVVDILNIPNDLNVIRDYVRNDIILVLNKKDLLPRNIKDEKIIEYFKELDLGFKDIIITSGERNYNIDQLYNKMVKYKKSNNVYVVGYTNAGKSSLITKLIENYSENKENNLTVSPLPSTTLNKVEINIDKNITLIDTPGIIDNRNMINFVDQKLYKRLNSKKEIRPRTYQLKKGQSLLIDNLVRLDYIDGDKNSLTFYIPNEINIKRCFFKNDRLKDNTINHINVKYGEDLCINGLGFIKIVGKCDIDLYLNKDILVFTRKNVI